MHLNPLESSFDAIPIARPYGVSESVKNIFPKNSKNNLCLLCNRSDKTTSIQRRSRANLSKSEFLLFFEFKVLGASKKLHAQRGGIDMQLKAIEKKQIYLITQRFIFLLEDKSGEVLDEIHKTSGTSAKNHCLFTYMRIFPL